MADAQICMQRLTLALRNCCKTWRMQETYSWCLWGSALLQLLPLLYKFSCTAGTLTGLREKMHSVAATGVQKFKSEITYKL